MGRFDEPLQRSLVGAGEDLDLETRDGSGAEREGCLTAGASEECRRQVPEVGLVSNHRDGGLLRECQQRVQKGSRRGAGDDFRHDVDGRDAKPRGENLGSLASPDERARKDTGDPDPENIEASYGRR